MLCAASCAWARPRIPSATRSADAIEASEFFWYAFHNGLYELIPDVLNVWTAAYLNDPNAPKTAAYIGAAHAWRLNERARLDPVLVTITDAAVFARKFVQETVRLEPHDAHYIGFLSSMMIWKPIFTETTTL